MPVETKDRLAIPVNDYSNFSEGGSTFLAVTHVLKTTSSGVSGKK